MAFSTHCLNWGYKFSNTVIEGFAKPRAIEIPYHDNLGSILKYQINILGCPKRAFVKIFHFQYRHATPGRGISCLDNDGRFHISRGDPVGGARDDALLEASINIL
jgi:hypothetical protein